MLHCLEKSPGQTGALYTLLKPGKLLSSWRNELWLLKLPAGIPLNI
jgi:hypothetical protein